ncbi:hypothetical protein R008_A10526 [Saccharomyces cerevisiae R008]|nr:hypothetical protein R008_A10526 [Saccharomyces cerevisiae R008]
MFINGFVNYPVRTPPNDLLQVVLHGFLRCPLDGSQVDSIGISHTVHGIVLPGKWVVLMCVLSFLEPPSRRYTFCEADLPYTKITARKAERPSQGEKDYNGTAKSAQSTTV